MNPARKWTWGRVGLLLWVVVMGLLGVAAFGVLVDMAFYFAHAWVVGTFAVVDRARLDRTFEIAELVVIGVVVLALLRGVTRKDG